MIESIIVAIVSSVFTYYSIKGIHYLSKIRKFKEWENREDKDKVDFNLEHLSEGVKETTPESTTSTRSSEFWESFGRLIGSLNALEYTIGMSNCIIDGQKPYTGKITKRDIWNALEEWRTGNLYRMSDTLYSSIEEFKERTDSLGIEGFKMLIERLHTLREYRNIFCHCHWTEEDSSIPLHIRRRKVKKKKNLFKYDFFGDEVTLEKVKQIIDYTDEASNAVKKVSMVAIEKLGKKGKTWNDYEKTILLKETPPT